MPMGQKELDRYNLKRGGTAGMNTLIKAPTRASIMAAGAAPAPGSPAAVNGALPLVNTDGSFNINNYFGRYDQAYNEAKTANEGRYKEGMQGYKDRYDRNMKYLEGAGKQEAADINEASLAQAANVQQSLTNSGLAGTTVAPTMAAGVERSRIAEQARLNERLQNQRVQTDAQLSGDTLGFLERREDAYPDLNQFAQTALQMGAAGMQGPGAPGAGGVGGAVGGAPVGGGVGRPTAATNYAGGMVTVKSPAGWSAGDNPGGVRTSQRPLTNAEIGVLKMGGIVDGYNAGSRGLAPAPITSMSVGAPTGAGAASRANAMRKPRMSPLDRVRQRRVQMFSRAS